MFYAPNKIFCRSKKILSIFQKSGIQILLIVSIVFAIHMLNSGLTFPMEQEKNTVTVVDSTGMSFDVNQIGSNHISWWPGSGNEEYLSTGIQVQVDGKYAFLVPFSLAREITFNPPKEKAKSRAVHVRFFDNSELSGHVEGINIYGETSDGHLELPASNIRRILRSTPEPLPPFRTDGAQADIVFHDGQRLDNIQIWRYYEVASGYVNILSSQYFETNFWLKVRKGAAEITRSFKFADVHRLSFSKHNYGESAKVEMLLRSGDHISGITPALHSIDSKAEWQWNWITGKSNNGYFVARVSEVASIEFR